MNETTQQVSTPPNPTGKGGFGEHPENRNPGGWKKEDSISYQYNRFLRMSDEELVEAKKDISTFTQAMKIALKRVEEAVNDLNTTKEITDRTEGKAPQYVKFDGNVTNSPYSELTPEELRGLAGS